jgi:hypothetical protein
MQIATLTELSCRFLIGQIKFMDTTIVDAGLLNVAYARYASLAPHFPLKKKDRTKTIGWYHQCRETTLDNKYV